MSNRKIKFSLSLSLRARSHRMRTAHWSAVCVSVATTRWQYWWEEVLRWTHEMSVGGSERGYPSMWPIPWCMWCTSPWTDRRLWKHYLSATSFVAGKNRTKIDKQRRRFSPLLLFHSAWMDLKRTLRAYLHQMKAGAKAKNIKEQECIPVGCVHPTRNRTAGGLPDRPRTGVKRRRPPRLWTESHTGVKTLPCRNFVAVGNKRHKL